MKKNYFEIAIIGGGFSALCLANSLKSKSVAIFEKLDRVGKKILSTGNGRGNLTNKYISVENYHGNNPNFSAYAIDRYSSQSIRSFFSNLGLMFVTEEDRVYPASLQANSILDALRFNLEKTNVNVLLGAEIESIIFQKADGLYKLKTSNAEFYASNVVFAFGASSQRQFGTDGKSFALAKSLGHTVTKLSPALVQMRGGNQLTKGLKGVKCQVKLTLLDDGKEIKQTYGDLLFTDSGISGNATFYLSSYLATCNKPSVSVEFIPEITENRLIDHLLYKKQCFLQLESSELLNGIVHKQLGKNIVKFVTSAKTIKDISIEDIKIISKLIKHFNIEITGTLGFDYSQVTHGGISTDEVDDKTFESKISKGLYIIGEALDIDGDCGGYNMQWAYSSAMCCAEALNGKNK